MKQIDKLNENIKIIKKELVDKYNISTDRDLFTQLGITSDEDKCKIFAWINYQSSFSIRDGYEHGFLDGEETGSEETTKKIKKDINRIFEYGKRNSEDIIEDGFGSIWFKKCPECGENKMQVVRPGKAQCSNCG